MFMNVRSGGMPSREVAASDDAGVGLVRDEQVDVGGRHPRLAEGGGGGVDEGAYGPAEDLLSLHLEEVQAGGDGLPARWQAAAAGGHGRERCGRAVAAEVPGQQPRSLGPVAAVAAGGM
jgi:hypothetical protein